jgi:fatty aldehyde-generating acyl-ACP reductase
MLPYLGEKPPWFVFLGHPRDRHDLHAIGGSSLIYEHSENEDEFVDKLCSLPPVVVGGISFGFEPIRGEMICVMRMPNQILRSRDAIVEGLLVATGRGAKVIGLGALTAPATRGGRTLVAELPAGVTLTNGNAYTAAVARHNVIEAVQALGMGTDATVAVVGCTGSVGTAAARLLAADGFDLTLVGRTARRVTRELPDLADTHRVTSERSDIKGAQVVLLLTSDPTAHLVPEVVQAGGIVIDLTHPRNVDPAEYPAFLRYDIRVAQGGQVVIPGYHNTMGLSLAEGRNTIACLAETYLFAKEGITQHSVGNAPVELARELDEIAAYHDVRPASLNLSGR